MLRENVDKLHLIATALIQRETLEASELEQLMKDGVITEKSAKLLRKILLSCRPMLNPRRMTRPVPKSYIICRRRTVAMPEGLRPGLTGEAKVRVDDSNTAEVFGNPGAKVFATPMLVALMEQAAIDALRTCLLPGEGSVGMKVEMTHLAATPVGMIVTAKAELMEVLGKRLIFDIVAADASEVVGKCRHERFIIADMKAFLTKVAAKGVN